MRICFIISCILFLTASIVKAQSNAISNMVEFKGLLYYTYTDPTHGNELFRTDGTCTGTELFKDIYQGVNGSFPRDLTVIGNTLFFSADDSAHGQELWKTDGTVAGTVMIKDIRQGRGDATVGPFIEYNGILLFNAYDGITTSKYWRSDGTVAGTYPIYHFTPSVQSGAWAYNRVGTDLIFKAYDGDTMCLWKTDATTAGTVNLKRLDMHANMGFPFAGVVGNILLFAGAQGYGSTDYELWRSDGTIAGTYKLVEIFPGGTGSAPSNQYGSSPSNFLALDSIVLFSATKDFTGSKLWRSNGLASGTYQVKDSFPFFYYRDRTFPVRFGHSMIFAANGPDVELWKSDGTAAGTQLIKDINPGSGNSNPGYMTVKDGIVYFSANDGVNGQEFWKSDGTTAGTVLVKDITAGNGWSWPRDFKVAGDIMYFVADQNGVFGGYRSDNIWRTDGTPLGTYSVTDCNVNNIATRTVSTNMTAGSTVNIPYNISGGFDPENYFSAELSDSTGSFAAPVVIGSVNSNLPGTITGTLPCSIPGGNRYRIRVVSTVPLIRGTTNGTNISIQPPPTPVISSASLQFCAGSSLLLTASMGSSYQWKKNGANIAGATNQTFSATTTGSYTVEIINSGCTGTSNALVLTTNNCTAVSSINPDVSNISLRPNRISSRSVLSITTRFPVKMEFSIYDATGRQVLSITKKLTAGKNEITLNLEQLASGTYYISGMSAKGRTETLRFIK